MLKFYICVMRFAPNKSNILTYYKRMSKGIIINFFDLKETRMRQKGEIISNTKENKDGSKIINFRFKC